MRLCQNKKGVELSTIAEIILILIAAGLIIGILSWAAGRASEKTSETLCRGFNAIRFGTRIDKGPLTFSYLPAPNACKTIDKKDLPGKNYEDYPSGIKEGAKAELRDMIAKCWWMWLEGKQPNIFDTSTLNPENKCFVCYAFSLKNGADITIPNFIASLDYPYEAVDSSQGCATGDRGGFCLPSCDKSTQTELDSKICTPPSKCCISKNIKDECINKGGSCELQPKNGYRLYDKWSCDKGSCYIKNENFVSYIDYVQGTNGAKGGAGFIVYEDKLEKEGLTSKNKYAVTLISPGNTWGWDTPAWGAATLVAVGATAIGTLKSPIFKQTILNTGAILTYASYRMLEKSGTLAGYNFIYLSEYDKVRTKCQVQAGADEK